VNQSDPTTDATAALTDERTCSQAAEITTGDAPLTASSTATELEAAVAELADASRSQTDFLGRFADLLSDLFAAGAVAACHPSWPAPMLWSYDEALAGQLEPAPLARLLESSHRFPTASDVPLKASPTGLSRTRCLHVRLDEDGQRCALAVVYLSPTITDAATQVRDLKRLSELVIHSRSMLAKLPATASDAGNVLVDREHGSPNPAAFERGLRRFHANLDLKETAYRIANETRRMLPVDRVTVLVARRGRWITAAVSGSAVVDRRSNAVTAAENFAERIAILGRPIRLPQPDPLPPQIADALDHYLDASDVGTVVAVPLFARRTPSAAESETFSPHGTSLTEADDIDDDPFALLLLEHFYEHDPPKLDSRVTELGNEAAIAMGNSLEHHRIFGVRALKLLGDWFGGRKLPYTAIALLSVVGLLIASASIRIEHQIIATGTAEPIRQQHVFARTDGVVKEIFVRDGDRVSAGDLLLRLENADLETRAEDLVGQIQTATRRLTSIRSILLDPATDAGQAARLAIESRQLESELAGKQSQLELIRQQLSALEFRSPIDGTVAGWQLRRKLLDRPVSRGNQLLTIVDDRGPWQLRLEIADKDTAEVIEALENQSSLSVQFAAASHPEATFAAELASIGTAARRNAKGINVVDALARVQPGAEQGVPQKLQSFDHRDTRVGVEATAKIACGQRSILSSWFGDVADFFHRNVWFYLR
jgi:multidrug efflux pump subunit AcrA (membrane-fusion protein)